MKINKNVWNNFNSYPAEMIYDEHFENGQQIVESGGYGAIVPLFSNLDNADVIDEWAEMQPEANYVHLDCKSLKITEKVYKSGNTTILAEEVFDEDFINNINKDNTVLFLENYCDAEESIRTVIIELVRNSRIFDYKNTSLTNPEAWINVPNMPLTIVHIDVTKVESIEPINEFEKMMLCLQ